MNSPKNILEDSDPTASTPHSRAVRVPHGKRVPPCSRCNGLGFFRQTIDGYSFIKRCPCRQEKTLARNLSKAGIPEKFRGTTLDPDPSDGRQPFKPWGGGKGDVLAIESMNKALEVCRELRNLYLEVFLHNKKVNDLYGLLLYGACGRGKTRLACSLLSDLVHAGLTQVGFIEYNELFKRIRFSYNSSEIDYQTIFDSLIQAKVLVIDDFGMEVSGNLVWVLDNIGYIINERYNRNRPTILTCNFWHPLHPEKEVLSNENPFEGPSWKLSANHREQEMQAKVRQEYDRLQERVSERLRSRIREMCYELKVEGYDYRNGIGRRRDLRLEHSRQKRLKPKAKDP